MRGPAKLEVEDRKMPQVIVDYDPEAISPKSIELLRKVLPDIVAKALSVKGTDAELAPTDVEVKFFQFGEFDVNHNNKLKVIVLANDYPARRAIGEEAKEIIEANIRALMWVGNQAIVAPPGFVWIRLCPGFFREFGV